MRAFIASLVLLIVISAGAYYVLDRVEMSAADVYKSQTGSVRL